MRIEHVIRSLIWWMFAGVALTAVLYIISCTPGQGHTPERSFTTMDLLIDVEAMPPGWRSFPAFKPADYYCVRDCASIDFEADSESVRRSAYQDVFRYKDAKTARRIYAEISSSPGETPSEWSYRTSAADEFRFACYDYEGQEPPLCQWTARYQEYVVVFGSWLIPDRMAIVDMERVAQAIDLRMVTHLVTLTPSP